MDLSFLKSTRFWKVVIVAVLESLVVTGVVQGDAAVSITHLIEGVLGISVVIRTVDRFGEKSGSVDTGI